MDMLSSVVSGFVVEVGKYICKCIYPKIENTVHFSANLEILRTEMEKLTKFRDDIKGKVEGDEGKGYKPKPDVLKWIQDVGELENEWETIQESIAAAKMLTYKCCPNCSLRSEISTQARNIRDQVCRLKEVGESFGSNLVVENYQVKKVEYIPVSSIKGQPAATRNLNKILQHLADDKVCIIGVWGTGGVGKTTLVNNLNNELLKTNMSSFKLSFGVVIWVTVPKPPIDIRTVQAQIANRFNLKIDNEGSVKSNASKIYRRLKEEKSFLLILDDVWEAINLDHVGVPQPDDTARSKLAELFVQGSSSQTTLNSEIPRVRKLWLSDLPKLGMLGEPQSLWEHLEELTLQGPDSNLLRKLPLSIQTSNNIKLIEGRAAWWSQLEWDHDNYKTNLEQCFTESYW